VQNKIKKREREYEKKCRITQQQQQQQQNKTIKVFLNHYFLSFFFIFSKTLF